MRLPPASSNAGHLWPKMLLLGQSAELSQIADINVHLHFAHRLLALEIAHVRHVQGVHDYYRLAHCGNHREGDAEGLINQVKGLERPSPQVSQGFRIFEPGSVDLLREALRE